MKVEILYAYRWEYSEVVYNLAHIAEEELCVPHLSFREAFKTSSLEKVRLGKEAYKKMVFRLTELDNRKLHDSNKLLASFGKNYGSGMGGRANRDIYSTNENNKLIIVDEAEDRDHAVLTDQIVSLISDISLDERKLIESDVSKLKGIRDIE